MDPVLKAALQNSEEHIRETAGDLLDAREILDEDLSDWEGNEFYNQLVVENAVHALSLIYRSIDRICTDEGAWSIWRIGKRARAMRAEAEQRLRSNLAV
jgi:hypothetical protein